MICSREFVNGYADAELDVVRQAEMEEHLGRCKTCSAIYAGIRDQQVQVGSCAPYYAAPDQLGESIRKALREAAGEPARKAGPLLWRHFAVAASVLLVASLGWNVNGVLTKRSSAELLARSLISNHVRSLIGTHLLDVMSSDQHTVKPWFSGKLDFSPEVIDCAPQGFPLIGGRMEYVSDRSAAALIYRRRQHVINLFIWPAAPTDARESVFSRDGFNVLQWSDSTFTYWAVSDLDRAELQQFRELCSK
jgi:anti-sigma factor RsiW